MLVLPFILDVEHHLLDFGRQIVAGHAGGKSLIGHGLELVLELRAGTVAEVAFHDGGVGLLLGGNGFQLMLLVLLLGILILDSLQGIGIHGDFLKAPPVALVVGIVPSHDGVAAIGMYLVAGLDEEIFPLVLQGDGLAIGIGVTGLRDVQRGEITLGMCILQLALGVFPKLVVLGVAGLCLSSQLVVHGVLGDGEAVALPTSIHGLLRILVDDAVILTFLGGNEGKGHHAYQQSGQ